MQKEKQNILLIAECNIKFDEILYNRISSMLKDKLNVRKIYLKTSPFKPSFLLFRWVELINNFRKEYKRSKPKKILLCGGPIISLWLVIFIKKIFRLDSEITTLRYDIENFRPYSKGFKGSIGHFFARFFEKYSMINSDKIIHKGFSDELKELHFYDKLKNKPHYLFREFLDKSLIQKPNIKKLSKRDKEFHLVYTGGLYLGNAYKESTFWNFYKKVTSQKIHLHIFSEISPENVDRFKEIEKNDNYFHYEGSLKPKQLMKVLGKYDFLFSISSYKRYPQIWQKSAFGNKYYDGICSYLPTIVPNNLTAAKDFVEENGVGFSIDFGEIESLKKILEKFKKKDFKSNIEKFIRNQNYDKLTNFVEK